MITNEQLRNKIKRCMVEGVNLPEGVNILSLTHSIWNYINETATTVRVGNFQHNKRTSILTIEDSHKNQLMVILLTQQKIEFLMAKSLRVSKYNKKALSVAAVLVVKGVEKYFSKSREKTLTKVG